VLALTSRRLLFIFDSGRRATEWPCEDIVDAQLKRGRRLATVFIDTRDQFDVFVGFEPRSAAGAIASALRP